MITVVGLGPAGAAAMSVEAIQALEAAEKPYLRTGVHPAAQELAAGGLRFVTFDHIYESAASFDKVYETIALRIIEEAKTSDVVYAVPGHPLVGERSVELILELAGLEGISVKIVGSKSFIEASLEALGAVVGEGLKVIDALQIAVLPPSTDCPSLIYQIYDKMIASQVKLALMDVYPDDFDVYVVSGAGGPEVSVEKLPLYLLDRRDFDHLTSVYVPGKGQERESAG